MRAVMVGLVLLAGCGGARGSWEVRAASLRATSDLACPRASLIGSWIGGGAVVVRGCGLSQTYTCFGNLCDRDGPPSGTHDGQVVPSAERDTDAVDTVDVRQARAAIARCGLAEGMRLQIWIGVDGHVLRVEPGEMLPATLACVQSALEPESFATREEAQNVQVVMAPPTPVSSVAPIEIVPPSSDEARVRATIDAARDGILACTGGAAVAVVGEWSADGSLVVHLPSAQAATPEDGCVRAAAAGLRLDPPPSSGGSVLHPIH